MGQKIKAYTLPGRQVYCATWHDLKTKKRVTRSLGTRDQERAESICSHMMILSSSGADKDSGLALAVPEMAYELWFGEPRRDLSGGVSREEDRAKIEDLQREVVRLKEELEIERGYRERYNHLSQSVEGQRIEAAKKSPTLDGVRDAYYLEVKTLSRGGTLHRTWFKRFAAKIGGDRKISSIKPGEIHEYIVTDAAKNKGEAARGKKQRALISRFFSWCAVEHGIPNPMDQVATLRVKAEKDIQWHSLEEIEAVLAGEPDIYWRAMIAILAFAGLSAHELRGLELKDVVELKGRRFLRVTPSAERGLKTHKRRRNVAISTRLAAILDEHLATLGDGCVYLFPAIAHKTRTEIWHADTLTRHLGEHLPEGMNALSLRRTFGSLLIRSGKSAEEVSAAMGNSAAMVSAHYGRILGGEVEIDF